MTKDESAKELNWGSIGKSGEANRRIDAVKSQPDNRSLEAVDPAPVGGCGLPVSRPCSAQLRAKCEGPQGA